MSLASQPTRPNSASTGRDKRWPPGLRFLLIALFAVALTAYLAAEFRRGVTQCPPGLVSQGPRCCPLGQTLNDGSCIGSARACSSTQVLASGECAPASVTLVDIPAGTLVISADDWESEGRLNPKTVRVSAFKLQRTEVTHAAWDECEQAGHCRVLESRERFLPVSEISAVEAEEYCKTLGGRLPTSDEWLLAAAGVEPRRYPWGQAGLVCRRVVYGLVKGPCATGADRPELVGARPDGATPNGLLDMAGNVAEWTRVSEGYSARGGSFRSQLAGELKTWASKPDTDPSDAIGVRCAFDLE